MFFGNGRNGAHRINGRVVVVTGASAGVGRTIVRKLARKGCKIGLLARGVEGLEGANREIGELGGAGMVLRTDVSKSQEVEADRANRRRQPRRFAPPRLAGPIPRGQWSDDRASPRRRTRRGSAAHSE